MAKSSKTRRGGLRLFSRALSLPTHLLSAAGQSAQRIGSTTGRIAKEALDLPAGVGHNFAFHGNAAMKEMFSRGGRRATRKGRKQRGGNNMMKVGSNNMMKGGANCMMKGGASCNKMGGGNYKMGGGNNMNSSGAYEMGDNTMNGPSGMSGGRRRSKKSRSTRRRGSRRH